MVTPPRIVRRENHQAPSCRLTLRCTGLVPASCWAPSAKLQRVRGQAGELGSVRRLRMIPAGYMAKHVKSRPSTIDAPQVADVYSVSSCISEDFADFINFWMHNGFWLFDSPAIISDLAQTHGIDLAKTRLFYYEVAENEFAVSWRKFEPEHSFETNVLRPAIKHLEGFDIASFYAGSNPECSPLSCNAVAGEVPVNEHCLLASEDDAKRLIESEKFEHVEPGPYRIFAVYSVGDPWPPGV